jgi:hypothetical protein
MCDKCDEAVVTFGKYFADKFKGHHKGDFDITRMSERQDNFTLLPYAGGMGIFQHRNLAYTDDEGVTVLTEDVVINIAEEDMPVLIETMIKYLMLNNTDDKDHDESGYDGS